VAVHTGGSGKFLFAASRQKRKKWPCRSQKEILFDFTARPEISRLRARPRDSVPWSPAASRTVIVGFAANDRSGSVASRHCLADETFNLRDPLYSITTA